MPLTRSHGGLDPALRFFDHAGVPSLFESGTQALAAALMQAKARHSSPAPEAILPAYGCPDLVSACVFANVRPVLVDVAAGAWGFEPRGLEAALTNNTVALVAVNFLGIGDDAGQLAGLARARRVCLIQDSAQHLPRDRGRWTGDSVVMSLGRGKPLNLLGGGLLLASDDGALRALPVRQERALRARVGSSRLAGLLFNLATHPLLYGVFSRMPGFKVGETSFHALDTVEQMPLSARKELLPALAEFRARPSYDAARWDAALQRWSQWGFAPLQVPGDAVGTRELLRLPVLAPSHALREKVVDELVKRGLGASRMYGAVLPLIRGVPEAVRSQGPFPNAASLADRLFTLPTHSMVRAEDVERVDQLVETCAAAVAAHARI